MNPLKSRRILRFLCRHATSWPGVWRLNLRERTRTYSFSEQSLVCRTVWGHTLDAPANDLLGNWLFFFGSHQKSVADRMKRIVRPGWNAIDVGANIGVFTVLLAECVGPTGRVLAVEPGSLALDYLRRNIIRSGFLDRVTVCAVAAGKRSGTVQLHVPAHSKNLGGSRIATQAEARTEDEKVPMRTLDAIWEAQGCPRCDFIKTDVEGGERDVLRGAERMFAATPPNACIVEFNTDAPLFDERGATALWNFFATRQYKPFDIRGNPITCRPTESADILFCRQQ